MEGSPFISTAEWNELVNANIAEVFDVLVQAAPPEYDSASSQIAFTAGVRLCALPADFRSLVTVAFVDGTRERPLLPLRDFERSGATAPRQSGVLTVEYTPTPPVLVADADTFDCVSGWARAITALTARDALAKEEGDTSVMQNIADREFERIRNASANRDRGQPKFIGVAEERQDPWWCGDVNGGSLRYRLRGGNIELFSI